MHEYALVQNLLDQVAAHAAARGATAVRKVTVGMGELAGVDPDLFATAFETFRAAGSYPEAELSIRWVEARWVCSPCSRLIHRGAVLRCPNCGAPAQLGAGDELTLERIELEIAEPQILHETATNGAYADD
jgi:hydrogenase nickel incorporation protein HypA/HybF